MSTLEEQFVVEPDDGPTLKFTGKLLAEASTTDDVTSLYFSGSTGRWTVLKLYQTKSGKFICERVEHNRLFPPITDTQACIFQDRAFVTKFFGWGALAKKLYEEAGFDFSINLG